MYYLVKYSDNWSDEMDLEGFALFTQKEFYNFLDAVEKIMNFINNGEIYTYWFCTNEGIEYDHVNYLLKSFEIKTIDALSYSLISGNICNNDHVYGYFPLDDMLDFIVDHLDVEEEEEEE